MNVDINEKSNLNLKIMLPVLSPIRSIMYWKLQRGKWYNFKLPE